MHKGKLVGAAAVVASMLVVGVGAAAGSGVDPNPYSTTLASGASVTITKTVHTPAIPPNPDIVFLADNTGSMEVPVSNVASNAGAIMNEVSSGVPSGSVAEFAAADYMDLENCSSDPWAFNVDQALTTNTSDVQTGINTWPGHVTTYHGGCDTPESWINALWTIANGGIGFRSNSTRVIVQFGDATSHDPNFGHTLSDAISALQGAGIEVLFVPVSDGSPDGGLDGAGQATAVASATGGQVLPDAPPNDVASAILSGLANLPVTVTPVPTCDSGLTATYDAASKTATSGTDVTFAETLSVAPNAPDGGVLHCTVDFLLNGISTPGFQQTVNITVPLRATDLSLTKTASPTFLTEGNNATYTLSVTNNGSDPDTNVVASDTLPAGESFVSGDPGCSAVASAVTCNFGTLGAGATASKSYVVHVALGAPSTLVNAASVTGDRPESNPADNSASATITVNHNPVCTALAASPDTLWPPNHKFVKVTVSGATDIDGDPLTTTITGVTQDEPLTGFGSGQFGPDAEWVSGHTDQVKLRAERDGTRNGRVYRIATTVTDGKGGSCTGTALVTVPHDQSGRPAVDSGLVINSFGP
jgi:uncharacterized repeat protein (TIGR01451 family)